MEITLRKAQSLTQELTHIINRSIEIEPRVNFDEADRVESEYAEMKEKLNTDIARFTLLTSVLYDLRKRIGEANTVAGISALLTDRAMAEKIADKYEELLNDAKGRHYTVEEIVAKLDKYDKLVEEGGRAAMMGGGGTVRVNLLSKEEIENYKSEFRRWKKVCKRTDEALIEKNVSIKISLSDREVEILEREDLL